MTTKTLAKAALRCFAETWRQRDHAGTRFTDGAK